MLLRPGRAHSEKTLKRATGFLVITAGFPEFFEDENENEGEKEGHFTSTLILNRVIQGNL